MPKGVIWAAAGWGNWILSFEEGEDEIGPVKSLWTDGSDNMRDLGMRLEIVV